MHIQQKQGQAKKLKKDERKQGKNQEKKFKGTRAHMFIRNLCNFQELQRTKTRKTSVSTYV